MSAQPVRALRRTLVRPLVSSEQDAPNGIPCSCSLRRMADVTLKRRNLLGLPERAHPSARTARGGCSKSFGAFSAACAALVSTANRQGSTTLNVRHNGSRNEPALR